MIRSGFVCRLSAAGLVLAGTVAASIHATARSEPANGRLAQADANERLPGGAENKPSDPNLDGAAPTSDSAMPDETPAPADAAPPPQSAEQPLKPATKSLKKEGADSAPLGKSRSLRAAPLRDAPPPSAPAPKGGGDEGRSGGIERAPQTPY